MQFQLPSPFTLRKYTGFVSHYSKYYSKICVESVSDLKKNLIKIYLFGHNMSWEKCQFRDVWIDIRVLLS